MQQRDGGTVFKALRASHSIQIIPENDCQTSRAPRRKKHKKLNKQGSKYR